jgi:hypothetical protein
VFKKKRKKCAQVQPDSGKAGAPAGTVFISEDGTKRLVIDIKGKPYLAEHLAWLYVTGEWPKHAIDHVNGDTLDNRWENLRESDRELETVEAVY